MASSKAGTSSDDVRALGGDYQVFLSCIGHDTHHGFTCFLYQYLVDVGVQVFNDDDELHEGEVSGNKLLHAINNSILYIPIFSRNYASSKWCLRKLALMTDNVSKSGGQKGILPIFFDVELKDVALKTPLYSDSLLEHKKKFPDEVDDWRKALEEIDKIKGWNVKKDQSQANIVESVVEKVLEKLMTKQKRLPEHLVGLDDRVKDLTTILDVNNHGVMFIAIYGMGGIGKTTIAKVVFNNLSSHFGRYCSFLEDVRGTSSTKEGIVHLQKKLLSDVVGSRFVEQFKDSEHGMRMIGNVLSTKKVLVVLDDVNHKEHIKKLIGNSSLHSGSRIIITTRNKDVMELDSFIDSFRCYEMQTMDDGPSLQLFCRHAFRGDFPLNDYKELSREIVLNTGGLPLAIIVLGSLLYKRNKAFWKEMLVRLKKVPEEEIIEKLMISYNDLDDYQQQIFLDIACFFFNKSKTDAIYMWRDNQFYPLRGIQVLSTRCLIKILDNDKFWMHDQLIDLGRKIVRQENPYDLSKQSRLWIPMEALEIIKTKEKKDKVQGLSIMIPNITDEDFERFPNLRFLDLDGGTYVGDFTRCRSNLRWFSWSFPPEEDFGADNLYLDRLVVCKLYGNYFKDDSKAWDLIKRAWDLKSLSFAWCLGITKIPDISKCLSLEILTLTSCSRLKRIESFIENLQSLIDLKFEGCRDLTNLPEEIGALVNLKHFSLSGCKRLSELPSSIGNLTSLTELDLSDTIIRELPNSIGELKSLRILRFPVNSSVDRENHEWQLHSGINKLINLEELDLSGRDVTGVIPVGIGELSHLRFLNLERTCICRIPKTINKLCHLQTLNLWDCNAIEELPELPTSLTYLHFKSESLFSVPNLSNLIWLVELLLSDDSHRTGKSNLTIGCNLRGIGRLSRLLKLELNLLNVPAPPELASLSNLEEVVLRHLDLKPLMQLPSSDWRLRNLSTLEIACCEVEDIPLEGLPHLEKLTIDGCMQLQRLSIPLELKKLWQVDVSKCLELIEIRVMGLSKSLEHLGVDECKSLTRLSGLSYLKNLKKLRIEDCNALTNVEGLGDLESLKSLEVKSCMSLRWRTNAYCTKIPNDGVGHITWCGDSIKDSRSPSRIPVTSELASLSYLERPVLGNLGPKPLVQPSSSDWSWRNLSTLDFYFGELEDIPLNGLHRLEILNVDSCKQLQRLSIPSGLRKLWQASVSMCPELIEIQVVGLSKSLKSLIVDECKSLTRISGLSYLKNLEKMKITGCNVLTNVEGLDELESLKFLEVEGCMSLRCLIDASCTKIPDDCLVIIKWCGDSIKNSKSPFGMSLKLYKEEILLITSNKDEAEFNTSGFDEVSYSASVGESETDGTSSIDNFQSETGNAGRDPAKRGGARGITSNSRKSKASRLDRDAACTIGKGTTSDFGRAIASSSRSSETLSTGRSRGKTSGKGTTLSSGRGTTVSIGTSRCSSSRRGITKTGRSSRSDPDEDSDCAYVGESKTDGTSSIDDNQSELYNAECFEAMGNRTQMRDERIQLCGSVDEGKTTSIENRMDKDEIGESANQNNVIWLSCRRCKVVEHCERSYKATSEVEDPSDLSSVKRDRTMETDRVPSKIGRGSATGGASNLGTYPSERGRGRGAASNSRNGKGLRLGRDANSTLAKGMASNSGRNVASSSRSSTTSSSGRTRGSTSGKGTLLSSGKGMTLSLGTGGLSSSKMDTTKMSIASSPGRGITSSSRSRATFSTGRGRGSTSGNGTTVSPGRGTTLSLGRGKTEMVTSLRSGTNKGSSLGKAEPQISRS